MSDGRPRGLLVTLRSFEGGMASAVALREALAALVPSKLRLVVHLPLGADTKAYFLASVAHEVTLFPGASLTLLGFAARGVYLRSVLDEEGVGVTVLARGRYKSAGESLSETQMSEAQREQLGAILDRLRATLVGAIVEKRGLGAEQASAAIDQGLFRAPAAKSAALVDAVRFDDEVLSALTREQPKPTVVQAPGYLAARRASSLAGLRGRACIGVLNVHGAITADGPLRGGASESALLFAAQAARASRRVKGVILHIESPGGSALVSARVHRELELLAEEKPLVAVMGDVAASGGYYLAAPAHVIVAQPVTVTGSIGVIAARLAVGALLDRLGVHVETLKRGARADIFDPFGPLADADREALLQEIDGTYQEFVGVVARGRKKSVDEIESLAQGRVWTGFDAHARGLVDQLGGFEVALAEVRRRVGRSSLEPRVLSARRGGRTQATGHAEPAKRAFVELGLEGVFRSAATLSLLTGRDRVLVWAPECIVFSR